MSSPTILAIETATSACSVALTHNDEVWKAFEEGNNIHSKVLLKMVNDLFTKANIAPKDLDAVAVGQGPGSFTGLRIGVGVGQGIAYGANCPMIGVSSLDVLAHSLRENPSVINIIAAIDARMGEIYWAEYSIQGHSLTRHSDLQVSSPEALNAARDNPLLVGNAWQEYWHRLADNGFDKRRIVAESQYPKAIDLLALASIKFRLGDTCRSADFSPVYVRNDVAKKSTKPLPGRRV